MSKESRVKHVKPAFTLIHRLIQSCQYENHTNTQTHTHRVQSVLLSICMAQRCVKATCWTSVGTLHLDLLTRAPFRFMSGPCAVLFSWPTTSKNEWKTYVSVCSFHKFTSKSLLVFCCGIITSFASSLSLPWAPCTLYSLTCRKHFTKAFRLMMVKVAVFLCALCQPLYTAICIKNSGSQLVFLCLGFYI